MAPTPNDHSPEHPDRFAQTCERPDWPLIDAVRAGTADPAARDHVHACPACRSGLSLLEGLAREFAEPAAHPVPEAVDRAVRSQAHARARAIRARRTKVIRLARWAAAAAAAVLVVWGAHWLAGPQPTASKALGPAEDLDQSGGVDIVDAYLFARRLERGEPADPALDLNDDGAVDKGDVTELARRVVAVQPKET